MPISESFFNTVKNLCLTDLLELLAILPILLRAKLAGVDLNLTDIQNSSQSGLHREATRTGRLERVGDISQDPPLAFILDRRPAYTPAPLRNRTIGGTTERSGSEDSDTSFGSRSRSH